MNNSDPSTLTLDETYRAIVSAREALERCAGQIAAALRPIIVQLRPVITDIAIITARHFYDSRRASGMTPRYQRFERVRLRSTSSEAGD